MRLIRTFFFRMLGHPRTGVPINFFVSFALYGGDKPSPYLQFSLFSHRHLRFDLPDQILDLADKRAHFLLLLIFAQAHKILDGLDKIRNRR